MLAILWGIVTPPWQGPDEPSHFGYGVYMARTGELPRFRENFAFWSDQIECMQILSFERIRFSPEEKTTWLRNGNEARRLKELVGAESVRVEDTGNSVSFYPPTVYIPVALIDRAASSLDPLVRFRLSRLATSVWAFLFGAATAWLFALVFPEDDSLRRLATAATVLQPQVTAMNGYVSPDGACTALFALAMIAGWRLLHAERPVGWPALMAGLAAGVTILTKQHGFACVGMLACVACLAGVGKSGFRGAIGTMAVFGLGAFLVAGWWIGYTIYTYGSLNPWLYKANGTMGLADAARLLLAKTSPQALFAQMWSRFGWLDTRYPIAMDTALFLLCAIGMTLTIRAAKIVPRWRAPLAYFLAFTAMHFAVIIGGVLKSACETGFLIPLSGRYFLHVAPAMMAWVLIGYYALVPESKRDAAGRWLVLPPIMLQVWTLLGIVIPRYYGTG